MFSCEDCTLLSSLDRTPAVMKGSAVHSLTLLLPANINEIMRIDHLEISAVFVLDQNVYPLALMTHSHNIVISAHILYAYNWRECSLPAAVLRCKTAKDTTASLQRSIGANILPSFEVSFDSFPTC